MRRNWLCALLVPALPALLTACSHWNGGGLKPSGQSSSAVSNLLQQVKAKYVADNHLGVYNVGVQTAGRELVLTGEVDRAEARVETLQTLERTGARVQDKITLLPTAQLGERVWGISCLSVASAREQPEHKAEMGTQVLMGDVVRVLKRSTNAIFSWYLVQSQDGYLAWLEQGTFVRCTRAEVEAWQHAPLLVVTAFEDRVLEQPRPGAQPVSDVVVADLVKKIGEEGDWYQVELPDQRRGFLPKQSAEDYGAWKQKRRATAENIERTGRLFLGRPYLWGGNSPKGVDCSGFTKLVFFLNGVELNRNASHQSRQGVAVPLDEDLSQLQKGDLLFFGHRARGNRPERIAHVGIYLGDKLFIQSSERVRLSSLDPSSPLRDEIRIRTLLRARRVLPPASSE
jgi:gamma-D-glutamyl-L-lysine dipeptidyl-peptidase